MKYLTLFIFCISGYLILISLELNAKNQLGSSSYQVYLNLNQNTKSGTTFILPGLGINYLHKKSWSFGLSIDSFNHKIKKENFKVIEVSKKIYYELRLYHPFYFQIGLVGSYIRALEKNGRFNLESHKIYPSLFSFSSELSFLFKSPTNGFLFKTSVRPWISPALEDFRGVLISASCGYSF